MEGETTIVVAGTPNEGEPEGVEEWESRLSEVIQAGLAAGFNGVRGEFQSELTTLRQSNSDLLQSNTSLTGQITQMNQTLMDRLPALTPPVSAEPIVVVLPEPESVVEESPAVETSQVETPPVATHRKRRLL